LTWIAIYFKYSLSSLYSCCARVRGLGLRKLRFFFFFLPPDFYIYFLSAFSSYLVKPRISVSSLSYLAAAKGVTP
jgi:hypothetical protein